MADAISKTSQANSKLSKTQRLEARITEEQKELFQRAAEIQGRTLTDFVISNLINAANQIIQEHEIMILSKRDQEVFIEALFNPPEPSAKLKAAAQSYKQRMGI
ncbi:DUF1778 domain-containing protein [Fortiea sp. LEGE XX443]|uniref:type II toxin-antitoxin system TacA family antitoxin n=1 Tax=Fortiea sp. LEGE XX443 TaxID=1828611 RepID=UPI001880122E|nr:DUF1778 domain-containing protein [Fortiea sp. LEGE XX443]MBE9006573.1 DUF1778 domain-containing protein [Fortiea sp. LEGE XX443]